MALEAAKEHGAFENKNFKGIIWWGHIAEPIKRGGYSNYPYLITKERAKRANDLLKEYNIS